MEQKKEEIIIKTYYVGVDPGLIMPAICIIEQDHIEPIATKVIHGNQYKSWFDYTRAFHLGKQMANFVDTIINKQDKIILCIEGHTPGKFQSSRSVEQLGNCRQAVYDSMEDLLRLRLIETKIIYPTTAKKILTGNGRASKEDMINYAIKLCPKTMSKYPKLKKSGKLNEEASAIADSIAITLAGMRKNA